MGVGVAIVDRNTRLERNDAVRLVTLPDSTAAGMVMVWRRDNQNPMVRQLLRTLKEHPVGAPLEER